MTLARTFEQTQESDAMMNSSTSSVSKIVQKQFKKPSIPKSNSEKGNSDQNCFACGKTGPSVVPPSARPRTLPVDSARRKDNLTQSTERSLHKSRLFKILVMLRQSIL